MNTIIAMINQQIARLQSARAALAGLTSEASVKRGPGRPKKAVTSNVSSAKSVGKKRVLSADARARIAAAQKARWAKQKKAK